MYGGLIVEEGPARQILTGPCHPYTASLLAAARPSTTPRRARPCPRPPSSPPRRARAVLHHPGPLADERCRTELPALTSTRLAPSVRCWHPGGQRITCATPVPRSEPGTGPAVVEVRRITKRFRSPDGSWRQAVNDVSFVLHAGEALGVVGESGSGKTTTAQIAAGMMAPDSGSVLLDGAPWSALRERSARRRAKIQLVYQDPLSSFDPRFGGAHHRRGVGRSGRRAAAASRPRIAELLGQVGLDETFLHRRGASMSGGQRQRVAIARALARRPEVLVCDEPVSALDVSVQAQILELFSRLRSELGVALLFISHDLGVIRQICDRVLVMKDELIVEAGDIAACSPPSAPLYADAAGRPAASLAEPVLRRT